MTDPRKPVDMTNARAAVYALREPLVITCPELTIDRVIADYCVSHATVDHEKKEAKSRAYMPKGRFVAYATYLVNWAHDPLPLPSGVRKHTVKTAVY